MKILLLFAAMAIFITMIARRRHGNRHSRKEIMPYPGEYLRKVNSEEVVFLQNFVKGMLEDNLSYSEDKRAAEEFISYICAGESFKKQLEDVMEKISVLSTFNLQNFAEMVCRTQENLQALAKNKGLEHHVKVNVRAGLIGSRVMSDWAKAKMQ